MPNIKLPVTRYYGSKRKLVEKIWCEFEKLNLNFDSVLDVFGGSGIFSYYAKSKGKSVIYNDIFKFNQLIGKALIETNKFPLKDDDILKLLEPQTGIIYKKIISENFKGIYFTDAENYLIDIVVQNIELMNNECSKASAYYILFQTCLIKRPFNLFHRKNLSLRTNHILSNFGNKKTWERTFEELFLKFSEQLKIYQFDNGRNNHSVNFTALKCNIKSDLVYIDPPYFGEKNGHVSYHSRYHFLEGLSNYDIIEENISFQKAHHEININKNSEFENKKKFIEELSQLIDIHKNSIIVISYRNGGYPSIEMILEVMNRFKSSESTHIIDLGSYSYALNRNNINNREYLIVGI